MKKILQSRDSFFMTVGGTIHEEGTLNYTTIGNCACAGDSPKDRKNGTRGYYITGHNIDSSFQQMNLIVGIAVTWQWVRKQLNYQ